MDSYGAGMASGEWCYKSVGWDVSTHYTLKLDDIIARIETIKTTLDFMKLIWVFMLDSQNMQGSDQKTLNEKVKSTCRFFSKGILTPFSFSMSTSSLLQVT